MSTTASPTVLAAQQRFRVLLDALAHPGSVLALPPGGADTPAGWLLPVAETLLDLETSFAAAGGDAAARDQLEGVIARRTGARLAPSAQADFLFVLDAAGAALRTAKTGDLAFPDRAATLIWHTTGFERGAGATLRGPGIADSAAVHLDGVPAEELAALADINRAYPCGLDVFFVDDNGRVLGLPRSTRITVARAHVNGVAARQEG